jgi:hypothetical protein
MTHKETVLETSFSLTGVSGVRFGCSFLLLAASTDGGACKRLAFTSEPPAPARDGRSGKS